MFKAAELARKIEFCRGRYNYEYYGGLALFHLGRFGEAEKMLQKSLSQMKYDMNAYYYLAKIYRAWGDDRKANEMVTAAGREPAHQVPGDMWAAERISVRVF